MFKKIRYYLKRNQKDALIMLGGVLVIISLFSWGAFGILKEVEIDNSYLLIDAKVRSIRSHYFVFKSATIDYQMEEFKASGIVRYAFTDAIISRNENIKIRVLSTNYYKIALDQDISTRITLPLFIILCSLFLCGLTFSAYKKKINMYYLDH